jgi:flagellin FlaB
VEKMRKKARKIILGSEGSIGIGAMIVFISMVLVAGIAASVLIQTSTNLESKALATGRETTAEVSSGLSVTKIIGSNNSGSIQYLAIIIRPRAGSADIDLGETVLEISNSSQKNLLVLDTAKYTAQADINGDIFTSSAYCEPGSTNFSIIVIEDADGSCSSGTSAMINAGDYVILGVNTTSCFGGLNPRDDVWGKVIPEEGSPGVINFRCPPSFHDDIVDLQ